MKRDTEKNLYQSAQTAAAAEQLIATLPILTRACDEIARFRKASYDAHIKAGFTPEQALVLCQKITP